MAQAADSLNVKGKWAFVHTGSNQWDSLGGSSSEPLEQRLRKGSGGATHMALLRGAGDSSWVAHWHFGDGVRLWLAEPGKDSTFGVWVPSVDSVSADTVDVFCAGHTILADGRLMVVGGTVVGVTGETRTPIFNPRTFRSGPAKGWVVPDTMKYGRWYATATTLGDGKVLSTSGDDYLNMTVFGGFKNNAGTDSLIGDLRTLNLRKWLRWDSDTTVTNKPTARQGHSVTFSYPNGRTLIFGGVKDSSGQQVLTNEVRPVFIVGTQAGNDRRWETPVVRPDAVSGLYPLPRQRHSAVQVDTMLLVYGGLGKGSQGQDSVLTDFWRLRLKTLGDSAFWTRDVVSGGPGARYGHTAVVDSIEDGGGTPLMLLFGGKSGTSTFADDKVWMLRTNRSQQCAPIGWVEISPSGGGPGKREGHVAVMDTVDRHVVPDAHRMVVFGGQRDTAFTPLRNDIWMLKRNEPGLWTSATWSLLQPGGSPPSRRTRAIGIYDEQWERLLIFGGDSTTTAGGESADAWGVTLYAGSHSWQNFRQDNTPVARQGAAAVFDPRPILAKIPELYTAGAAGHDWQALTSGFKWQDLYPLTFQLRSGKIFYAGNEPGHLNTSSWLFDVATQAWTNNVASGIDGGSAVILPQYLSSPAQDSVMKCGAGDNHDDETNETRRAVIEGTTTTWSGMGNLPTNRRFHNLAIVPDGRTLMTGGFSDDDPETYARIPYFYHNGTWGPTTPIQNQLAGDPVGRSYHSAALLLPDARILCAGGPPADDTLTATIYAPPYLYKNGTLPADRPTISSYPTHALHRGEPFFIDIGSLGGTPVDSIEILSLIRPGAVTHSFDQNQRYVRLSFEKAFGLLRAVLPDNDNMVPPGDYLLFAVKKPGVGAAPSVGKWLRIEIETDATPPAAAQLSATPGPGNGSIPLSWTAPGDDGTAGTATSYDLRYRTGGPVTEENFANCAVVGTLPPRTSGNAESHVVTGLPNCTTHYFGLKTSDERGNLSELSTASASTLGCGGGGGGGCEFCEELPPSARPAEGYIAAHDEVARLGVAGASNRHLTLAHAGTVAFHAGGITAVEVTPAAGTRAMVYGGEIGIGVGRAPERVASAGGDITSEVEGGGHAAALGETLTIEFPVDAAEAAGAALMFETETTRTGDESAVGTILVQRSNGSGSWRSIAKVTPRPGSDRVVIGDVDADQVRLAFGLPCRVGALRQWVRSGNAPAEGVLAARVRHSRLGEVADPLNAGVVIEPGDVLEVSLEGAGTPGAESFLRYHVSSAASGGLRGGRVDSDTPAAFALAQNEPNPFGEGTVIRFALPTKAAVTLEVFDIHGRRVRILTKAAWHAGYHSLSWDGRDREGRRVTPGVYLYRMIAGSFQASRKLAILP